eukprot:gnl/MRDRNA2_/MRDRNA2_29238_c0_seq1.p1 gnl/MRDRNA2_/MRDRNA2_29238_c0~~gnl/MRDRNA2_/MRDRNA2_29238_c0_seq1.p1  ORF type:complete len:1218 (-),score=322.40 gnl/MRDRNA2_/MRDRNA2_29238_c0_seq1:252-3905(-)
MADAAANSAAPAISLAHRHVFGLKADVKSNVHYAAEENQVLYPAGHNTVLYFTDQKTQKIFPGVEGTEGITCLAVSPNRKYMAVAERCPDHGICTVFDLNTGKKKRGTLSYADSDAKEHVCVAFSAENKFLITQGGPPDWTLVYWAWDKGRPLAATKASNSQGSVIHECSFNPQDSTLVCVIGDGIFKFFRLQEGTFKNIPNQLSKLRESQNQNYMCHAWLNDDRLIVCCESGDILLFDNGGEFKVTLPCSPMESRSLLCVRPFSRGFITGGEDSAIRVFERSDDPKEVFKKTKDVRIDGGGAPVGSLAVSPSEELLAVSLGSSQLFQLSLSSSDLTRTEESPTFDYVLTSFHSGAIQGMDVCARKPLVVTCGMDKSVRVWNYIDKTCELCKTFSEEAYSVAFHPSGFHLIVGFSDKLRLMNLLMEDMRSFKEIPIKACRECRFSNGGQYFAAVNSNTIQVYKTYTCEVVCNLRGHNSKVRSLCWTADDSSLVSAGMDGAVYEYNIIQEGRRLSDWVHKGTNFSCVIVYTDPQSQSNTMYVVGSDKMLKEIHNSQLTNYLEAGTTLGQLVLANSGKTIFAGVAEADSPGPVRCYKFPLDGEFVEYQAHAAPCSRIRVTYDDSYLFSSGEDGCLYIFDVRKKDRVVSKRDKEGALPFADEILVTRAFLDDKQAALLDLDRQVEELTNQIDFQLRHRDSYHKEKMAELEDKYGQEIDQERTKYELLREEKNEMEMEYEENIKNLEESHAKQTAELEQSFQHKMMIEVQRYQKLAQDLERERKEWQAQHAALVEQHGRVIETMKQQFEQQQRQNREDRQRILEEKEQAFQHHQQTLRQLEQDADREIEELKEMYEEKLAQEKDEKVRLRGQAGIHRKHHEDLKRQMNKKEDELKTWMEQNKKKQEKIDALMKDKDSNVKEIKERDKTIGDKETRIGDLKKQNQELEKFKFVLDYKIKELKAQIDPKNEYIAEMKTQILAMDAELEDYMRKNKQLALDISQLQMKQRALQEEIKTQKKKLRDDMALIKRFKIDLHECMQFIQEPKQLKEAVALLYSKYVQTGVKKLELDTDSQKEYNRQRDYLEKSVDSLKRKLQKDSEVHRIDNMRIMQENVSLIREINDLRREINFLKHEGSAQEATASQRSHRSDNANEKTIQMQREEMAALQRQLEDLESEEPPAITGQTTQYVGQQAAPADDDPPEDGGGGEDGLVVEDATMSDTN